MADPVIRRSPIGGPIGHLRFGSLWQEMTEVAARNRSLLAAGLAVLVVADLVLNAIAGERAASTIGNIVGVIALFLLIREMLRQEKLVEDEGGFGTYFLASLLSGLGVIVGLILLIVPGLYLLARWSIAPTLVLARHLPAVEAMKESWRVTGDAAWTLVGFYVVIGLGVVVLGFIAGVIGGLLGGADGIVATVLVSIVANLFLIVSAALSVAIYRLLAGNARAVSDVFE